MKKLIAVLLLLSLFVVLISACDTKTPDSTSLDEEVSREESEEDSGYLSKDGSYRSKKEVKTFDGKEFVILVRGGEGNTYQSDDFTTDSLLYGDLLNDAVAERNNRIEDRHDVSLKVVKSESIDDDIRAEAVSSNGAYHAVMPTLPSSAIFAQEGYLYDLRSIESFDLNAPWWDERATEAFSVGGKVYFTTGDITILNKVCTPSILFNKAMIADYSLDNPYDLVAENKWTFDKLMEMAKAVTQINSPGGKISEENNYGLLASHTDALSFYGAAGEMLCDKDKDDLPYLVLGSEKSITVAQKILSTLSQGDATIFAQDFEEPIWETSFAYFYEGRVLFRPSLFSATTKARQLSGLEFGILPLPLLDENQEKYNSYCDVVSVAGLAIMKTCPDIDFATYMVEMYAAEAKNLITPAYYEVNLRYKDTTDEESLEMLDIIFDNIIYDIGRAYNFGNVSYLMTELMAGKNSEIVSKLESRRTAINTDISLVIVNFQKEK